MHRNYHQRRVNSQALQVSIIYSMMGMFICKHEPFWQEVSVESLILGSPLKPVGLVCSMMGQLICKYDMQVLVWYASTGMICKYDMQVLVWYASSGMICKYDMQVPVWYASMSPPDKKSVQSLQLLRPVSFFFVVEIWITDP